MNAGGRHVSSISGGKAPRQDAADSGRMRAPARGARWWDIEASAASAYRASLPHPASRLMPLLATVSGIRGVFGDGLDPAVLVRYAAAFGAWLARPDRGAPARRRRARRARDGRRLRAHRHGDAPGGRLRRHRRRPRDDADGRDGRAQAPRRRRRHPLGEPQPGAVERAQAARPPRRVSRSRRGRRGPRARRGRRRRTQTVGYEALGTYATDDLLPYHIEQILALPFIDADAIRARGFRVVVDAVNSVGAFAIPALLARARRDARRGRSTPR